MFFYIHGVETREHQQVSSLVARQIKSQRQPKVKGSSYSLCEQASHITRGAGTERRDSSGAAIVIIYCRHSTNCSSKAPASIIQALAAP